MDTSEVVVLSTGTVMIIVVVIAVNRILVLLVLFVTLLEEIKGVVVDTTVVVPAVGPADVTNVLFVTFL